MILAWQPTWFDSKVESVHGCRVEDFDRARAFREAVARDGGECETIDGFRTGEQPWRTKAEARAEARAEGGTAVFHDHPPDVPCP